MKDIPASALDLTDMVDAIRPGNGTGDGGDITWLTVDGQRIAAIVPADLVQYALRHGWGR